MRADISFIIAENKYSDQSDPHTTGVITVPWEDIKTHGKLLEIADAMSDQDRAKCEEEGFLRLTVDYGFEEDYKSGVGLVMRDLTVDESLLSPDKHSRITDWLRTNYTNDYNSEQTLQDNLNASQIKRHVIADMNIAGMSLNVFKDAIQTYPNDEDLPLPLEQEDVANIVQSLQERGITDIEQHYNETAMDMREKWPSSQDKNYGHEENGQARVLFFAGFNAVAPTVLKSGQYAYQPAWPSYDDGAFEDYDENGIARDEDGQLIASNDIVIDKDYIYHPVMAFSTSLEGDNAMEAIDRWILAGTDQPLYNGQDKNCLGVAGDVVFGEKYADVVNSVLQKDEQNEIKGLKVTNDMMVSGMLSGAQLPNDIQVANIYTPIDLRSSDPQGLRAAFKQIDTQQHVRELSPQFRASAMEGIGTSSPSATAAMLEMQEETYEIG